MTIQRLEQEPVCGTSTCFEIYACVDCYCTVVQCDGTYVCEGLRCPKLSDYD